MKFKRQFVVLSTMQGADNRVFAFFNEEKDALEYASKFPKYMHVSVYEKIVDKGRNKK